MSPDRDLAWQAVVVEEMLGFRGGATFYRDGLKVSVDATRYYSTDDEGIANRWWGTYVVTSTDGALADGAAYARFSDGSETEITLEATDATTGRFVVAGSLADSTTNPQPDI
jgi:hypothetical protein